MSDALPILITNQLPEDSQDFLQQKWKQLNDGLGINSVDSAKMYTTLVQGYREEHRAYHNLSHIYSLLQLMEKHQEDVLEPSTMECVIWYHDAIYDPLRKNNEALSAELAANELNGKISSSQVELIKTIILSTTKHQPLVDLQDNGLLLDFDLAVLAAEPALYEQYTKAIRQEYAVFPDSLYKPGRKRILESFIDRPQIYFSEPFQPLERKARRNLEAELLLL